ncbi:MAG: actin-binding WH2 domain-containing protein, partial [Nostoc sp.]
GSQLGWTLRPFFGTPDSVFQLFREREGNFYLSVIQAISYLLGIR